MRIVTSIHTSLARIWPDECPVPCTGEFTALRNEVLSFQVAYRAQELPEGWGGITDNAADCIVTVESPIADRITLRRLAFVPVMRPVYAHADKRYERSAPGLYPDPLLPVPEGRIRLLGDAWQSLWVTVDLRDAPPSAWEYPVKVCFAAGEDRAEADASVTVIDASLPEQDFLCTNWFHCDCIADRYGCEVFSERFWELAEKYAACAARGGQNMILTPCFTPPLDTPVGGERRTVQLVDVEKRGGVWHFGFEKLTRYVRMCERAGIRYFEHSHLFTQWGAEHAPKIMGTDEAGYRRLFGWETDATGDDYREFLRAYLTALKSWLEESGVGKRMYFHISDEPWLEHLENYRRAHDLIADILKGWPIFDAMSHYEFYEQGLVDEPVAVTSAIDRFAGRCDRLWAYYCGGQVNDGLSNRLIATPPAWNRILGFQMYKCRNVGFLHWGFNFWYTTLSRAPYDPFVSPDAESHFTGGTSYLVYPGTDGPVESARMAVFAEALQDIRAMQLLESLAGRETAEALLEKHFPGMDFHTAPETPEALLALREDVNRSIARNI